MDDDVTKQGDWIFDRILESIKATSSEKTIVIDDLSSLLLMGYCPTRLLKYIARINEALTVRMSILCVYQQAGTRYNDSEYVRSGDNR